MTQIENGARSRVDLQDQLACQSQRLEDLAGVVWSISSCERLEQILCALMEVAMRHVGAEVGGIFNICEDRMHAELSWGLDAGTARGLRFEGTDIVTWVVKRRSTLRLHAAEIEVGPGAEAVYVRSLLALPIIARDTLFGVLLLVNARRTDTFTTAAEDTAQLLVCLAAVAIQNAQLFAERLERQKLEQQLELARSIQRTLLPSPARVLPQVAWHALYTPAFEVGGDYYDLIPISDHEVAVVIADVASKGLPAALLMTSVRSVIRAEATRKERTARVIERVNRVLCNDFCEQPGMFVSVFYGYLNTRTRKLTYTNAGHPAPFLWDATRLVPSALSLGGPILGQFEDAAFDQAEVYLGHGWRLWAFTDGVTEVENPRGELFGSGRAFQLACHARGADGATFLAELKHAVDRFANHRPERDDLTALWVAEATTVS